MVYLIHFEKPFKHAKHYVGYCSNKGLERRIKRHKKGNGSRLLRAVIAEGIDFAVVKVWPEEGREFERLLHRRHGAGKFCPVCSGAKEYHQTVFAAKASTRPDGVLKLDKGKRKV